MKSMFGFGTWKCSDGGMTLFWSAPMILNNPHMPAASLAWPKFVFTDPTPHICLSPVTVSNAWLIPLISIGSPSCVPVPCASM
ncbi:hypothetical protein D3C84_831840 [compost metagenome]